MLLHCYAASLLRYWTTVLIPKWNCTKKSGMVWITVLVSFTTLVNVNRNNCSVTSNKPLLPNYYKSVPFKKNTTPVTNFAPLYMRVLYLKAAVYEDSRQLIRVWIRAISSQSDSHVRRSRSNTDTLTAAPEHSEH